MPTPVTYRSAQLAGPGKGGFYVRITPLVPSFWEMTIAGEYQGIVIMDDFGFATKTHPATYYSLRT